MSLCAQVDVLFAQSMESALDPTVRVVSFRHLFEKSQVLTAEERLHISNVCRIRGSWWILWQIVGFCLHSDEPGIARANRCQVH